MESLREEVKADDVRPMAELEPTVPSEAETAAPELDLEPLLDNEIEIEQPGAPPAARPPASPPRTTDRKSTRLNSSHLVISYAVFCLKKKTKSHPWCPRKWFKYQQP